MASYYKRIQTVISFGEEDLYHFVESQNMKNSLFIKKLIREEMLRQAGKGVVLPTSVPTTAPVPAPVKQSAVVPPQQEVKQQETPNPPVVENEENKPNKPIKVGGGLLF